MSDVFSVVGKSYDETIEAAKAVSLTEEYTGCNVHVNATIKRVDDCFTVRFAWGDWYSDEATLVTVRNGRIVDVG